MIAVSRNPALLRCTRASFLESMVRAAELGLRFAGAGGEAYLVPYKSTCTLIIGYRGLCALARRTGKVLRIEARCVYEQDEFAVSYGSGQNIVHRPHLGADRGELIAAYALAELKDGGQQLEVMTRGDLDTIMKRSRATDLGPWRTDFAEMCRKTVVRRLCKYLPFPTAFEDALAAADPEEPEPEPLRRFVPNESPEGEEPAVPFDPQTGEILDGDAQVDEGLDDSEQTPVPDAQPQSDPEPEAPVEPPQGKTAGGKSDSPFKQQKASLVSQIRDELAALYPGDSAAAAGAKLKLLHRVFGKTVFDEIAEMPLPILLSGIEAIKAESDEAETDDCPI